jgi:hypothetical protein
MFLIDLKSECRNQIILVLNINFAVPYILPPGRPYHSPLPHPPPKKNTLTNFEICYERIIVFHETSHA